MTEGEWVKLEIEEILQDIANTHEEGLDGKERFPSTDELWIES